MKHNLLATSMLLAASLALPSLASAAEPGHAHALADKASEKKSDKKGAPTTKKKSDKKDDSKTDEKKPTEGKK